MVKHRNPALVIIFSIITAGIYYIVWVVKTKNEIKSLGGEIPTAWLIIIPIVNLYFWYKYSKAFSIYVEKDKIPLLWFLLFLVCAPIFVIFVQLGLNRLATQK